MGAWSSVFTLRVDTTSPTAPLNLVASAGKKGTVALKWNASSDAGGLDRYEIYRSTSSADLSTFTYHTATATTAYTDWGLTRGKTYWYYIEAVDKAGNRSVRSSIASAKAR